jgi:ubiquitin C-terminal hydrolase
MRCLSRMREGGDNGTFTGGTGYGCSVIGAAALQLDDGPGTGYYGNGTGRRDDDPRDTILSEDKEDKEDGWVDASKAEDEGPIVDGDVCEFVGMTNKQEIKDTGGYMMHNGKGLGNMKVIIVKLADYTDDDGDESDDDDDESKDGAVRGGSIQMSNGLVGLQNMGNTCYLNSAIQCLSNTRALTEFFCQKCHEVDLNKVNVLGTRGQLAKEYANLMRNLWVSKKSSYQPRSFMKAIAKHNTTFAGNRQQDSQELLSILLACLSEDLNRVLKKPYLEQPESNTEVGNEPVSEYVAVADEWWSNHLRREYSVIEALFTGQFKSTIHFPDGRKSSTFEPFSCLQLPLPFPVKRTVPVNIYFPDGRATVRCSIRITLASTLKEAKEELVKFVREAMRDPSDTIFGGRPRTRSECAVATTPGSGSTAAGGESGQPHSHTKKRQLRNLLTPQAIAKHSKNKSQLSLPSTPAEPRTPSPVAVGDGGTVASPPTTPIPAASAAVGKSVKCGEDSVVEVDDTMGDDSDDDDDDRLDIDVDGLLENLTCGDVYLVDSYSGISDELRTIGSFKYADLVANILEPLVDRNTTTSMGHPLDHVPAEEKATVFEEAVGARSPTHTRRRSSQRGVIPTFEEGDLLCYAPAKSRAASVDGSSASIFASAKADPKRYYIFKKYQTAPFPHDPSPPIRNQASGQLQFCAVQRVIGGSYVTHMPLTDVLKVPRTPLLATCFMREVTTRRTYFCNPYSTHKVGSHFLMRVDPKLTTGLQLYRRVWRRIKSQFPDVEPPSSLEDQTFFRAETLKSDDVAAGTTRRDSKASVVPTVAGADGGDGGGKETTEHRRGSVVRILDPKDGAGAEMATTTTAEAAGDAGGDLSKKSSSATSSKSSTTLHLPNRGCVAHDQADIALARCVKWPFMLKITSSRNGIHARRPGAASTWEHGHTGETVVPDHAPVNIYPEEMISIDLTMKMSKIEYDNAVGLSPQRHPNIEQNRTMDKAPISLQSCFESFTAEESGVEVYQKGESVKCSKKIDIWRLPPVLIIHLKRFQHLPQFSSKLTQCVEFPLEGLDLSDSIYGSESRPVEDMVSKMSSQKDAEGRATSSAQEAAAEHCAQCARNSAEATSSKSPLYDLYGVVNHHGKLGSGHYNAYVKHAINDSWFSYDDDSIRKVLFFLPSYSSCPSCHFCSSSPSCPFYSSPPSYLSYPSYPSHSSFP